MHQDFKYIMIKQQNWLELEINIC